MNTNAIRIDVLRMAFVLIRVDSWLKQEDVLMADAMYGVPIHRNI